MKIKTYVLIALSIVASLLLAACNGDKPNNNTYTLPDLSGKTIRNYTESLDSDLITIVEETENHETIVKDGFIRYGNNYKAGDEVEAGTVLYVYFSLGPESSEPDTEGPVILGADDMELPHSTPFDPLEGITVYDNVDGDLMDRLIVTGDEVDVQQFGEYVLKYTVMDRSGNMTSIERTITVVPAEIDTRYTDQLKLDQSYEGKNFLDDGIGEVTFVRGVDGDTAHFRLHDGQVISVRFNGIDTPETSNATEAGIQPWGQAAARFTTNKLKNAKTIVLEAEGAKQDTYGRGMAWVWVDGRLLNLEIVENAFSTAKGLAGSKYEDIFMEAERKAMGTKKHIWSDDPDPEYDYVNKRYK